ncbi:MAG: hypothetical protein AVO34_04910 [Firmicutes bacterium ML8_F2]|nr:MAG: hypothetical protein AVO34_04910 [Firmicutes bacterium ML8_F2]
MREVILQLDPKSKAIIEYLSSRRHVSIHELALAAKVHSHTEALSLIRKTINPLARRLINRDLLVLKRVARDPVTGELVTYHWWIEESFVTKVEVQESGEEVVVFLSASELSSFNGRVEAWVSEKNAVVRVFKGGFPGDHKS